MKKALSLLLIVAGIINLVGLQKSYIHLAFEQFSSENTDTEQTTSFRSEQLRLLGVLPKFGFENLFADGIFLKFLQYFGNDSLREQTGYSLSPEFFDLILTADPYYTPYYLFASSSSTMYAGQPSRAVALLNRGLKQLKPNQPSDAFLIWRYKGTDELLFIGDSVSAGESYQTAADWATVSDHPDSEFVAQLSQEMVKSLQMNRDNKTARIKAWLGLFNSALDNTTRRQIVTEIQSLGGDIAIDSTGKVNITFPAE
ncbi:MAG: hypothetical protein F6K11_05130 [Leptolyngbya sp. SIO3F4]|nr:hypothetical protein [Leptolyngbya sp. SIO3F4]